VTNKRGGSFLQTWISWDLKQLRLRSQIFFRIQKWQEERNHNVEAKKN